MSVSKVNLYSAFAARMLAHCYENALCKFIFGIHGVSYRLFSGRRSERIIIPLISTFTWHCYWDLFWILVDVQSLQSIIGQRINGLGLGVRYSPCHLFNMVFVRFFIERQRRTNLGRGGSCPWICA